MAEHTPIILDPNQEILKLLSEGPSIMYVQNLEEKLTQIEDLQQQQWEYDPASVS